MSQIINLGPVGFNPTGNYDNTRAYEKLDMVLYQGSSYVAKQSVIGQLPTNVQYWDCVATGTLKQFTYDSVAEMKLDNSLENGMYASTVGYYEANDGGAATYKITSEESQTEYQEELENGLYATLIIENKYINALTFGLNENNDCSEKFEKCLDYAENNNLNIYIPSGVYTFETPIEIPSSVNIYGNISNISDNKGTILKYEGIGTFITLNNYANMSDLELRGKPTNNAITMGSCKIENLNITGFNIGVQLGTDLNSPCAYLDNIFCRNCTLGFKLDSDYSDDNNYKYCQDTTLIKCRCNDCLNGYYINDYSIHLITINAENGKVNGVPIELGANAKNCTILNSYLENSNVTKEMIINASAKYNEIKGFRYLGWYSKITNNGDGTNIIICPSISNQTVQFQHGKTCFDYLGVLAKDDYSSIYGIEKTSDSNITEGVTYGSSNIFKNYDTKLIHKLENFTARNRTNATVSNFSVTQTVTPQSINVASKGTQNISFGASYFSTTANTKFIAMPLVNSELVINFYKNDNYLIMHIYNPTDATIQLDPIPVAVLCWEQS